MPLAWPWPRSPWGVRRRPPPSSTASRSPPRRAARAPRAGGGGSRRAPVRAVGGRAGTPLPPPATSVPRRNPVTGSPDVTALPGLPGSDRRADRCPAVSEPPDDPGHPVRQPGVSPSLESGPPRGWLILSLAPDTSTSRSLPQTPVARKPDTSPSHPKTPARSGLNASVGDLPISTVVSVGPTADLDPPLCDLAKAGQRLLLPLTSSLWTDRASPLLAPTPPASPRSPGAGSG